ncbi:regulatory protein, luxR family [Tenacibaculum sp. MAR_2009_124]|uniref:helix-turn-helix transcriptional regulator n=1 Tax=Tenacibaculum sp. MAR_2009_124 TaxID=1250059 RepID=UPI0008951A55|nr:helix-turn-helix transcriptional regulator [Tenacibaculum sp. MAR_2009_124]SEC94840.1 regulatory protein, luxR family [Tenacibaculum sp. MAR_2009_124]
MKTVEIVLLIITYTLLIVALFLQLICYKRKIETIETVYFTISLLLLILSITADTVFIPFSKDMGTSIPTMLSMVLIAVTTPLQVISERKLKVPTKAKKSLFIIAGTLICFTVAKNFLNFLVFVEYLIAVFLGVSIIVSMIIIQKTIPKTITASTAKIERFLTYGFIMVISTSLLTNYVSELNNINLKMGFLLPLIFMLLAISKIWDDLERLALFKAKEISAAHNINNYSFTKREKEIAELLINGMTYKQISEELFISIPTVKTHVSNVYKKCQVKSKFELIKLLSI